MLTNQWESAMRGLLISAVVLAGVEIASISAASAQSRCERLWVARNQIFKDAGYCFKTRRAIAYFGNAGCQYDSESRVPLSRGERARVARLQAEERELGCAD
jgi:YARHG domain